MLDMGMVIGPILKSAGGDRPDTWDAEQGVSRVYPHHRIEDEQDARDAAQDSLSRNLGRSAERGFFARFAVLNLIGVALVAAAWAEDLLAKPYQADTSGMCWLITALFAWGIVCCIRRDWQSVRWAGNVLVYLGMVGTVLGLIMTVSDLSVDSTQSFESFKQIVSAIYIGSGTALYANLLASIGYLWLGTNAHLLARQEV
jgi:NADH:ubiquinone oxidoreductase subunit 2 (subunit N)